MTRPVFLIKSHADVGPAIVWMCKRLRVSVTALVGQARRDSARVAPGNSSLVGAATGTRVPTDLNLGPLLRVLAEVRYEFFVRSVDEKGLVVVRPNSHPLRVVGVDGGRIDMTITSISDVTLALNTMALANDATVTGLTQLGGSKATSLTSLSTGAKSAQADVRINPLMRLLYASRFEAGVRPMHASARAARMAFAQAATGK